MQLWIIIVLYGLKGVSTFFFTIRFQSSDAFCE